MTAEEKAIDLWNKFMLYAESEIPTEANNNIRHCCILCVDEIIDSGLLAPQHKRHLISGTPPHISELEYWQKVRKHIITQL